MSRSFVLAGLPVILVLSAAGAQAAPLDRAFGNTIVSTYPDGRTAQLWLEPSGDYQAMGRHHDPSRGHWKLSGDQVCLRQSRPVPMPMSYCTGLPSGDSWTAKAVTGEPLKVRLVKGRGEGGGQGPASGS
jgi:hypothetical protein